VPGAAAKIKAGKYLDYAENIGNFLTNPIASTVEGLSSNIFGPILRESIGRINKAGLSPERIQQIYTAGLDPTGLRGGFGSAVSSLEWAPKLDSKFLSSILNPTAENWSPMASMTAASAALANPLALGLFSPKLMGYAAGTAGQGVRGISDITRKYQTVTGYVPFKGLLADINNQEQQ